MDEIVIVGGKKYRVSVKNMSCEDRFGSFRKELFDRIYEAHLLDAMKTEGAFEDRQDGDTFCRSTLFLVPVLDD